MTNQEFTLELQKAVAEVDWSQYECACEPSSNVPKMWAEFLEKGDPEWEFGNNLCHQGTLYSALFPLLPLLIRIVESNHPVKGDSQQLLDAALDCAGGPKAYARKLSDYFKENEISNPFNPSERMSTSCPYSDEEIESETKAIEELQTTIRSALKMG